MKMDHFLRQIEVGTEYFLHFLVCFLVHHRHLQSSNLTKFSGTLRVVFERDLATLMLIGLHFLF